MNKWSEILGVDFPECNMCGQCCRCASPSTPTEELYNADSNFAKDFFSIFQPYKNIDEARRVSPSLVERSLKACDKSDSKVSKDNIVFYHCKFLSKDNKCTIYEDRPQLCRDYPDSPLLVFSPECAYNSWSQQCREKYIRLKEDLENLKSQKKQLENLKYQQRAINLLSLMQRMNNKDYNLILILPSFSTVSPGRSWIKIY